MPSGCEDSSAGVWTTHLVSRRSLSRKAFEAQFTRPSGFAFVPGQRICLVGNSVERDYSLVSGNTEETLLLCIQKIEGGMLSPLLASASIGSPFQFTGPYGYFTFVASQRPAVFIATGTGIAPFVSMARSGITGFTLLHGAKTPEELHYMSLFRKKADRYIPCLSRVHGTALDVEDTFPGRVTGYLEKHLPPGSYDFYLCGSAEMIRDVTLLTDERFPGSLVHVETFY
jgi:benzoate/toluate 1,2-dioxygenase reductase component